MAANSLGTLFRITTFGESHGKMVGVVIDGCPSNLALGVAEINSELALRAPGKNDYTSPRKEDDLVEIVSGVFDGKTTGAPICLLIKNTNCSSAAYEPIKECYRPGHANFTYLEKYGIFDYRGGGRASARETACRVAAGAVAKKLLLHYNIQIAAYIKQVGEHAACCVPELHHELKRATYMDPVYCPDATTSAAIQLLVGQLKEEGDSVGGLVECVAHGLPSGLGDPVYQKLEANLAAAMLSIPASKGFEIGSGFSAVAMRGSQHNDAFMLQDDAVVTKTNHAGGTLGGISTGMPLVFRVAFKPASSIQIVQDTVDVDHNPRAFTLPEGSRHDPCVAIRAVPVVEAMAAIVLADALLMNRASRLT